jgi:hypothetical protein
MNEWGAEYCNLSESGVKFQELVIESQGAVFRRAESIRLAVSRGYSLIWPTTQR